MSSSSFPQEIVDSTEELLKLLLHADEVPFRAMDKALRSLRPSPPGGMDQYGVAIKLRIKQAILSNTHTTGSAIAADAGGTYSASTGTSTGPSVLVSFEQQCERLKRNNPRLLNSMLTLLEPLSFPKRAHGYFQSTSTGMSSGSGTSSAGPIDSGMLGGGTGIFRVQDDLTSSKANDKSRVSTAFSSSGSGGTGSSTVEVLSTTTNTQADALFWVNQDDENKLIRDLLFIFQGISGTFIKYDTRSAQYIIDPTLGVPIPVQDTVYSLCELGWLYSRIHEYIHKAERDQCGVVVQAFCFAMQAELHDYYRLLSILDKELSDRSNVSSSSSSSSSSGSRSNKNGASASASVGVDVGLGSSAEGPSGLTLVRLRAWMQEPLERMMLLARLVDSAGPLTGGALASRLHGHKHHGDKAIQATLQRIMVTVCGPIYDMLRRWILHGELHDPYQEFFVGHRAGVTTAHIWQDGYYLRMHMLPTFFTPSLAKKVFVIGKTINFMKLGQNQVLNSSSSSSSSSSNMAINVNSSASVGVSNSVVPVLVPALGRFHKITRSIGSGLGIGVRGSSNSNTFEGGQIENNGGSDISAEINTVQLPISADPALAAPVAAIAAATTTVGSAMSYGNEERLIEAISQVTLDTDTRLLRLIENRYHLQDHLYALKQFLLLGQGDFVVGLMDTIGPELKKRATLLYRHNLTGMLEGSLRSSNAQFLASDVLDRVGVKLLQASPGDSGWEVFTLDYMIEPPLTAIVHKQAMVLYRTAFHMLWRLKRVEWTLASGWKQLLLLTHSRGAFEGLNRLKPVFHRCSLNRARMLHVVTTLNTYLMFEVLENEWQMLEERLVNNCTSLEDVIDTHDAYLQGIVQRALLTSQDDALNTQLQHMLQAILRFCSLEDTLVADTLSALARRKARNDAISGKTSDTAVPGNKLSGSSRVGIGTWVSEVGAEDPNSFDGVPAFVVQRLDEAVKDYSNQFDNLMAMLHEEKEDRMTDISRFLALRLDFNGYHASVKSQGKSGVITGTPPVHIDSGGGVSGAFVGVGGEGRSHYQSEAVSGKSRLSFI